MLKKAFTLEDGIDKYLFSIGVMGIRTLGPGRVIEQEVLVVSKMVSGLFGMKLENVYQSKNIYVNGMSDNETNEEVDLARDSLGI